jgi:Na+/H+ antiporter NhaC
LTPNTAKNRLIFLGGYVICITLSVIIGSTMTRALLALGIR